METVKKLVVANLGETVLGLDPETFVWVAVGVLLASLLLVVAFVFVFRRVDKRNAVLVLGIPGAGKTTLFYLLRDGELHPTLSSLKENEGTFFFHGEPRKDVSSPVHLVDIPGHLRLRPRIHQFLPITRSIVFVIDAVDFLKEKHLIAEYLYDLLVNKTINDKDVQILLACNKMDLLTATPVPVIKEHLEKEINELRTARESSTAIEDDQENALSLGIEGEKVKLDELPVSLSWSGISAKNKDIESVKSFIRKLIR